MTHVTEGKMQIECDFMTDIMCTFLYVSTLFENDCQQSWNFSRLQSDINGTQRNIALGCIRHNK
jgi:hypothetical protein